MKIAVIGGGIAGLSAAYLLAPHHDVVLFEKDDRLGGHAHTVSAAVGGKTYRIDTGAVGFARELYPNLIGLFDHLGVRLQRMKMSWGASVDDGIFEFSSHFPRGVFVLRNIVHLWYWKFLLDLLRFGVICRTVFRDGSYAGKTIKEFADEHGFSDFFRTHYLYPIIGSYWSTPQSEIENFSAEVFVIFSYHGHLLPPGTNMLKWYSVTGGTGAYVEKLVAAIQRLGVEVRGGVSVQSVSRGTTTVSVHTDVGEEYFDALILAVHADQALTLLTDASPEERECLSAFTYQANRVVLHHDASLMPRHRNAWAAWNFRGPSNCCLASDVSVTYDMRILHDIKDDVELFVTLNPDKPVAPETIYGTYHYAHPLFSPESTAAQKKLNSLQGVNKTYYCGSYFGFGFHEDGIASAVAAVKSLGVEAPWVKKKSSV